MGWEANARLGSIIILKGHPGEVSRMDYNAVPVNTMNKICRRSGLENRS